MSSHRLTLPEMHKAGQATGAPGFDLIAFMLFICVLITTGLVPRLRDVICG